MEGCGVRPLSRGVGKGSGYVIELISLLLRSLHINFLGYLIFASGSLHGE